MIAALAMVIGLMLACVAGAWLVEHIREAQRARRRRLSLTRPPSPTPPPNGKTNPWLKLLK